MDKKITFKEIRKYISWMDRVSICMIENGDYFNYSSVKEVPESFDESYLYGIGVIESEFSDGDSNQGENQDQIYKACMEITLTKKPHPDI